MGDNNEGVKEEAKDIQLTITIAGKDGQLSIGGPGDGGLYDEPLCFWMLEKAKDFIKMNNARIGMDKNRKPEGIIVPGQKPFYRNVFGKKK